MLQKKYISELARLWTALQSGAKHVEADAQNSSILIKLMASAKLPAVRDRPTEMIATRAQVG